jgi:hypothetical protein
MKLFRRTQAVGPAARRRRSMVMAAAMSPPLESPMIAPRGWDPGSAPVPAPYVQSRVTPRR